MPGPVKRTPLFWLAFVLTVSAACAHEQSNERAGESSPPSDPPAAAVASAESTFDFERPDLTIELHDDLEEISGLTLLSDGRLGAVQDEEGIVFVLDRNSGDIVESREFGERGDYEGIEQAGDVIFVLRSDGALIEIAGTGDDIDVRVVETSLSDRNDTEGLAYDASRNRLLIACKERPGAGLANRHKAIYAFDLTEGALLPDPVFTIDGNEIERLSGENDEFKPSALAIHPATGAVYLLSSTTRMIAVLDAGGVLRHVSRLPRDLFQQPEGLAFLPDGTMYIASEGDGDPGMLYAFSPRDDN